MNATLSSQAINGNTGEAIKKYGIPCIMTESGTPYPIRQDDVLFHYMGFKNLMRHIGMIDEEAALGKPPVEPKTQKSGHRMVVYGEKRWKLVRG